jgi:hypothetical protein
MSVTAGNNLVSKKGFVCYCGNMLTAPILRNVLDFPVSSGQPKQVTVIWSFQGDDYEECRLLGYKTPVCTSQETHYVSATGSSQLMLCKIGGFNGGD